MHILMISSLCIQNVFLPFLPSQHPYEVAMKQPHIAFELTSPTVLCLYFVLHIVPLAHNALRVERDEVN